MSAGGEKTSQIKWVKRKVGRFRAKCLKGAASIQQLQLEQAGSSTDALFATAPNGEPLFNGKREFCLDLFVLFGRVLLMGVRG